MGESGSTPVASRRGSFWVGIEPLAHESGTLLHAPMFVQWEEPLEVRHPYPLVLVHGGGGQGTDYLTTPDGRPGWADNLVELGYKVFVVDRPAHGRSPVLNGEATGVLGAPPTREFIQWLFTPPFEGEGSHPTAHLHTRWPGTREADDPVLDQFWAGTGPMLADFGLSHALEGKRIAELLDRIGEAVVVTHSAGGPAGWVATDLRPDLVKALVAIETMGPPFVDHPMGFSLVWGLAASPLTYDPPAADPKELVLETRDPGDGRPPFVLQTEPARRLPNLARVPIAVVSGEASVFVHIDEHTIAFLEQAGCTVERVRLADHGVHGNGHGMMLETNSREALTVILDWLDRTLGSSSA